MQSALRPYVTTGVAIAGAAVLFASPIVVTPQLHLSSSPVVSMSSDPALASVATDLAAAVNAVVNGFVMAGAEGVGLLTGAIDAGALLFDATIDTGTSLLSGFVSYPLDAATAIGGGLVTALVTLLGENPFTLAIADIANGFLGAGEAINLGLTSAIGVGGGVVTDLVDTGAGLLTNLIDTPATALVQLVAGFEGALTAFAAGDPAVALEALTAGFTNATQTVIGGVTDAFPDGIALAQSLITAGTQLVTLAIQTPLAAGQSVVGGFIDAFNEFFPPASGAAVNGAGGGRMSLRSVAASGSPSGGATPAPVASTPRAAAVTITLPPTASPTSSDVTSIITGGTVAPGVGLGAAVSTAASGGKSKAGTQPSDTGGGARDKGLRTAAGAGSSTGKSHRHAAQSLPGVFPASRGGSRH